MPLKWDSDDSADEHEEDLVSEDDPCEQDSSDSDTSADDHEENHESEDEHIEQDMPSVGDWVMITYQNTEYAGVVTQSESSIIQVF